MPERFGRYELVRRIGVGGMAELFLARSSSLDGFVKEVVIKRIRPELSVDAKFSSMFIDEGRVSITLSHPNIVQVFDFGEHQGAYYLAMEYVEGCNLLQLHRLPAVKGVGLEPPLAFIIIGEVLKALDYAHNKKGRDGVELHVIHRDVSPHNVLLSFDGAVKLGDFGIAKARTCVTESNPNMVMGKVAYMSPEHLRGDPLDHRTDLFSCGILLWELLVGRYLFAADVKRRSYERILEARIEPPSTQNPRLPSVLDSVVMRALAKEPAERYATARDFGREVHAYLVRHHPDVNVYNLQSFVASQRAGLTAESPEPSSSTAPVRSREPHPPAATRPASERDKTVSLGRVAAPQVWSEAVRKVVESFKREPSLWLLARLGETCEEERNVDAARVCYRTAALEFARRGLLAQALFMCRRMLTAAPPRKLGEVREIVAAVPGVVGHGDPDLTRGLRDATGPMAELLQDMLAGVAGDIGDAGQPTPILSRLDGAGFLTFAEEVPLVTFSEGAAMVRQGESGRTMFLIARGRVIIYASPAGGGRVYLSSLTAGDFFGENGFFTGSPRSATVETLSTVDAFEIDRELYNRITADHPEASGVLLHFYKERIVETVLAKSAIFGLLDIEQRRAVVDRFTPRIFRAGELVIKEGARSDQIYLVKDGEAEVFTERGSERVALSVLGPGTLFGEVAALRGIPRTASVQARSKLEVLELGRGDFETLLAAEPDVKRRVLDVVSQRARENIDKLMGGMDGMSRS